MHPHVVQLCFVKKRRGIVVERLHVTDEWRGVLSDALTSGCDLSLLHSDRLAEWLKAHVKKFVLRVLAATKRASFFCRSNSCDSAAAQLEPAAQSRHAA